MESIFIIDPPGTTGKNCKCGRNAMFVLGIYDVHIHICEQCIGEVAKRIIDGLV